MGKLTEEAAPPLQLRGLAVHAGLIDEAGQAAMAEDIRQVVRVVPMRAPVTPSGRKMSVRMSAAGDLGWVSDAGGYRYSARHHSGIPWPPIPASVLRVWELVSGCRRPPDSCLINLYGEGARMGMHRDADEACLDWPVVSVSLGDDALFRIGNLQRGGRTESVWLHSGDVVVMGGEARLRYHGIDRIRFGSSKLLCNGGRLNLTLRVAG
ncbi:MAG: alpha-ketoglutarate-dependent dioxygenase AlkB [Rhodobacteraceae bacterium]|nr:alpha-ketoglutarate-dependent dioxygenase AlkB [Paracoccaceae bacterium]